MLNQFVMTSRERVLASINHKQPDCIPIDLGSTPSSGISAIAYNNIKKYLGIKTGSTRIYDVVQQIAIPEDNIINRFSIDVLDLGRTFCEDETEWYPIELSDKSKGYYPTWFRPIYNNETKSWIAYKNGEAIARMPEGSTFFDQIVFPYEQGYPKDFSNLSKSMDRVLWSAFAHSPWDKYNSKTFWQDLRDNAIKLRQTTNKAIMFVCGCNLFEWGTFLRRMDNFLVDTYINQKNTEKLLDALLEIHLDLLEKVCHHLGDVVDIIRFGDDLGMETGPFMSKEVYRKLFKSRHKKLCDYVHSKSNMKTFLHSCGSIYRLLPDLIEAGYDIINPVQTTAFEMEPRVLKNEFGKDITFWGGGCNTRTILNGNSEQAVREHKLRMLDIFSNGGGFVFTQEHNILPDVPPQNIVAMFDAITSFNGAK